MDDSPWEDCLKESIKLDDEEKQNLVGEKKRWLVRPVDLKSHKEEI